LQLADGGLAVDLYPQLLLNMLWPKYWLRPLTKRVPSAKLFRIITEMVAVLLPFSKTEHSCSAASTALK
jgi:hypothetical protein